MTPPLGNLKRYMRIAPKPVVSARTAVTEPWLDGRSEIPEDVHGELIRAARLVDELARDGAQLRYDIDEDSGRVVATLCSLDGARMREIPLVDALGSRFEISTN